jgi:hypothetical protein
MKTTPPTPRPTVGALPILTGGPSSPIRGIANGKVVVHVLPNATAKHLRDMAATLLREADEMEGKA